MSRLKHTLNSIFVITDLMISATPIRILHMFITVMLGSIYSLFNALYFLNNGTILQGRHYAYNVLNWDQPQEAIITCILCVVQSMLSQIILYELYKFRSWIYTKAFFGRENDLPCSEMQSIMTESPKYSTIENTLQSEFPWWLFVCRNQYICDKNCRHYTVLILVVYLQDTCSCFY